MVSVSGTYPEVDAVGGDEGGDGRFAETLARGELIFFLKMGTKYFGDRDGEVQSRFGFHVAALSECCGR